VSAVSGLGGGGAESPAAGAEAPVRLDFLSGEAELAYAHEQMWGAYWTGARLLVAGAAMAFGTMLFAFFYLRSINSSGLWYVRGERPSLLFGIAVLILLLLSAGISGGTAAMLRRRAAGADWLVGSSIALGLGLAAAALQAWEMGRVSFHPGSSGYASMFVGWQVLMILAMVGGVYWLETLIARGARVRRVLRPLAISAAEPDVTMFRGSLDGFVVYWNFLALVEVVVFVLFYLVH
jgi:heme/copper-type cytochrome/quinol oxidase subunit 3